MIVTFTDVIPFPTTVHCGAPLELSRSKLRQETGRQRNLNRAVRPVHRAKFSDQALRFAANNYLSLGSNPPLGESGDCVDATRGAGFGGIFKHWLNKEHPEDHAADNGKGAYPDHAAINSVSTSDWNFRTRLAPLIVGPEKALPFSNR